MCAALSEAACAAIQRWVAQGGRLIADLLPGVFTAHGRLRGTGITPQGALQGSTSLLDQVFGVTPGARPPLVNDTVALATGLQFPVRCLDSVLVATAAAPGGTGTGDTPIWFQQAYQLGHAAYLGCSVFADFPAATRPARLAMEEAFATLLRGFGLAPHVQAVDAAAAILILEINRYRPAVGDQAPGS
jgi:hypothetical protein